MTFNIRHKSIYPNLSKYRSLTYWKLSILLGLCFILVEDSLGTILSSWSPSLFLSLSWASLAFCRNDEDLRTLTLDSNLEVPLKWEMNILNLKHYRFQSWSSQRQRWCIFVFTTASFSIYLLTVGLSTQLSAGL